MLVDRFFLDKLTGQLSVSNFRHTITPHYINNRDSYIKEWIIQTINVTGSMSYMDIIQLYYYSSNNEQSSSVVYNQDSILVIPSTIYNKH